MTATDYANEAGEFFVLSESFIRIKELIDDETSTINDISDVIVLDPALAGTILKLANSSFFNYPGKIDTISKAVLVLGITEIYNLVIAFFTTQAFRSIDAEQPFLDDFWQTSVDCALLIKFFGYQLNIVNSERLFILGILHNLGELIVKQVNPKKIIACQKQEQGHGLAWKTQRKVLGFTHGECSAELLKLWQLPYSIVAPIRHQDAENFDVLNTQSQLLYIAKRMVTQPNLSLSYDNGLLSEEQLTLLGINEDMVRNAIEFCDLERLSILSLLNPAAATIY